VRDKGVEPDFLTKMRFDLISRTGAVFDLNRIKLGAGFRQHLGYKALTLGIEVRQ